MDARQGPAEGVTPVLTPMNPSVFKSRFVFLQDTVLNWLKSSVVDLASELFFTDDLSENFVFHCDASQQGNVV